ncbi:NADH-quinone oxidoreductase subunit J family protein [Sulfurospirillum arcachonense]|uniref:NADH-quinone oxidoreductase subunit J family protein n=1 Tax=Sulfurospirillum arcachonense TaxID=57666 RepID=UPI00046A0C36|nr:NADH-quinone oxidoreductase subunit J [Sulfurospirillum arcachonense]
MIDIIFIVLSIIAISGAMGMILFSQTIYSALSLIVTILALAGVFALLSAPFLFMVQIIIYAGAIITLLLFIIMFLNIKDDNLPSEPNKMTTIFIGAALLLPFNILVLKAFYTLPSKPMHILGKDFGSINDFGMELFRSWLVPFELISMLLLAALIGAVVYARKEKAND